MVGYGSAVVDGVGVVSLLDVRASDDVILPFSPLGGAAAKIKHF